MSIGIIRGIVKVLPKAINRSEAAPMAFRKFSAINLRPMQNSIGVLERNIPCLDKQKILAEYCSKNGLSLKEVSRRFADTEAHINDFSAEHMLQLTKEGKITLFSPRTKKAVFILNQSANDGIALAKTEGILNYMQNSELEAYQVLEKLLAMERNGKILPENISEILKMYKFENMEFSKETLELIEKLSTGKISNSQIKQAQYLINNEIPLEVFDFKNLKNYSKEQLREWSLNFMACRNKEYISQEMFAAIRKELQALSKVNKVSPKISQSFLEKFNGLTEILSKSELSVDKLKQAGGIELKYSRNVFKKDILKEIEHLPIEEQNKILNRFGLNLESGGRISGLPLYIEGENLSNAEKAINNYIQRFLSTENKVVLPQGFEELAPMLDEICKAIPEFKFTIGAVQHSAQDHKLAEHMLKAIQENMKNLLYKELSPYDRRILNISTLLHDINKIEGIRTPGHALPSSQTVEAIVERMKYLTPAEKDRIINLVKNHHWLERVSDKPKIVEELATVFRSGNDFKLAKIFAESDLKAVNNQFFEMYGKKINSPATKAIENSIMEFQRNGKMMFTMNINTQRILDSGAKTVAIGEGSKATNNIIIDAKQMGLDKGYFGYHASNEEGLMNVISSCGHDRGMCLSLSIGKDGACPAFGKLPQFVIFDKLNINNLGLVASHNANTKFGKSLGKALNYMKNDKNFANRLKEYYPHSLTDEQYVQIFREIQGLEPHEIGANKTIQKILGGSQKAKDFEKALIETNADFVSAPKWFSEAVAFDFHVGAVGVKGKADMLSYEFRKFLEENNVAIIENIR